MRTSHIWPVIAFLGLLWPAAAALAQDMWVTTPDGTLSIPLYRPQGPTVDPRAEIIRESAVGHCLHLRAEARLPLSAPGRDLTAEQRSELAQCEAFERYQEPVLFADMQRTLGNCLEMQGRFDPLSPGALVGMSPPVPTPAQARALAACENLERWIESL